MNNKKTALISGATGLVGAECLNLLVNSDLYEKVFVLARSSPGEKKEHPKVEIIRIDFDKLGNIEDIDRVDHIFCALGTTIKKAGSKENFAKVDRDYPLKLARLGLELGANHYLLVSAMGANPDSKVFYNKIKGEAEAKISKLNFRSISFFRPSLLLGKREEFRLGEEISKRIMKIFDFLIPRKYKAIPAKEVAASMLYSAKEDKPGVHIYESDEAREAAGKYLSSTKK